MAATTMNPGSSDSGSSASGIDVVIPVYGAAEALDACLASVLGHSRLPPHRLVVVVDGPQSDQVETVLAAHLDQLVGTQAVKLVRCSQRRGFVASVNRGMAGSDRDVVLLNSDTEVTAGWLDKLQAAAGSDPRVATVTPFSNNATICSLPEFLEANLLPAGHTPDSFGRLVEACSQRLYPQLPTGVGVCLYIKRAVLDQLGLLDEDRFGLGYGEEVELCLRASAAGHVHLLDDSTFIFHLGQRSFGASREHLVRRASRVLRRMHRTYISQIADFIRRDPVAPARRRVLDELDKDWGISASRPTGGAGRRRRVLHVVHGWPPFNHAGTEIYARWLATSQVARHDVSVYARIGDPHRCTGEASAYLDRGVDARLVVNNFDQRNPLARNAMVNLRLERDLSSFLERTRPDLIHFHHLSGLSASLLRAAATVGRPIVYQVQDWWALCPRANLVRGDHSLCSGPGLAACSRCLPLTGLPPAPLLNRLLYLVRRRLLIRMLGLASTYVMGSHAIQRWYQEAGMLAPGAPVHVLPYGVPPASQVRQRPIRLPLRFGYIGSIMPHKGVHVAVQAFRGLSSDQAELRIWGNPEILPDYSRQLNELAEPGVVKLMGTFAEADKGDVLGQLDILLVPSVGLESFGIVAREAMAAGVPVLASRLGALAELEIDGRCGALIAPGDSDALRAWIDRLIAEPGIIDRWRAALPHVKTTEEHALEIDQIYQELLGRH
jgi:glycosyltransferase involved in cell wall biosynthesis/GT2 family glycosyltransferase